MALALAGPIAGCATLTEPVARGPTLPQPPPAPPQSKPSPPPREPSVDKVEPEETPAPPPPARRRPSAVARERRALELERRGDLARALVEWKILGLVEPDNARNAEREEETARRIAAKTAEHVALGDQARARGDGDAASEQYLKALALSPLDAKSADRLRSLEAQRVQEEESAKVRKLARRTAASGTPRPSPPAASNPEAGYYLETGVTLLRQGEYEAAVVEIEKYLATAPDDRRAQAQLAEAHGRLGEAALRQGDAATAVEHLEEAKRLGGNGNAKQAGTLQRARERLAEELYQKGVRSSRTDLAQAIDYWKQCLSLNPKHVGARSQLDRATRIQDRLKEIR